MGDLTPLSSKAVDIICGASIFCDRFNVAVDMDVDYGGRHVSTECHGTDLFSDVAPVVLSFTVMPDKSIYVKNEKEELFSVSQFGVFNGENRPSYDGYCIINWVRGYSRCFPIEINKPFYDCYLTSSNPSLTANQKKAVNTFFRSIWTVFPEIITVSK
jgi:hypothetical protein